MVSLINKYIRITVLVSLFLLTALSVQATQLPRPKGYVNDFAGVMSAQQQQELEALLTNFERQSGGVEIAVVTIQSVPEADVDGYAVDLFAAWGIGKKGADNGLLILAAINDRRGRIEVGYGLEGIIPDAVAGRVLRQVIFPEFKKGDYGNGLVQGALVLVQRIAEAKKIEVEGMPQAIRADVRKRPAGPLAWIIRIILLIGGAILFIKNPFLFFLLLSGGRGGIGGGGGGFSGGGFGGFGGGLSGGGGAGGGW